MRTTTLLRYGVAGYTALLAAGGAGAVLAAGVPTRPDVPVLAAQPLVSPVVPVVPVTALDAVDGEGQVPPAPAVAGPQFAVGTDPFVPTRLVLPDGTAAPVVAVGLHPDGSLVVPDDPAVVGWWTGGAQAGDAFGSVVLAGHVDSRRLGIGVLARLRGMRPGQQVTVEGREGSVRYRVSTAEQVPQVDLGRRADLFGQDHPGRLVLITCGGPFDPSTHHYRDNLVLQAVPAA